MATTEPRPTQTENGAGATGATQKRYRTLAVVKQEAVTRVEKQLEDSVFVWPHLLVREFLAAMMMTVVLTVTSHRHQCAAARSLGPKPDAEPSESAVVFPRLAGDSALLPADRGRRADSRLCAGRALRCCPISTATPAAPSRIASFRLRCSPSSRSSSPSRRSRAVSSAVLAGSGSGPGRAFSLICKSFASTTRLTKLTKLG